LRDRLGTIRLVKPHHLGGGGFVRRGAGGLYRLRRPLRDGGSRVLVRPRPRTCQHGAGFRPCAAAGWPRAAARRLIQYPSREVRSLRTRSLSLPGPHDTVIVSWCPLVLLRPFL